MAIYYTMSALREHFNLVLESLHTTREEVHIITNSGDSVVLITADMLAHYKAGYYADADMARDMEAWDQLRLDIERGLIDEPSRSF